MPQAHRMSERQYRAVFSWRGSWPFHFLKLCFRAGLGLVVVAGLLGEGQDKAFECPLSPKNGEGKGRKNGT